MFVLSVLRLASAAASRLAAGALLFLRYANSIADSYGRQPILLICLLIPRSRFWVRGARDLPTARSEATQNNNLAQAPKDGADMEHMRRLQDASTKEPSYQQI